MNFKNYLLLFFYMLNLPKLHGDIIEKICINKLESVVEFYKTIQSPEKQVLGVYDWDEVINADPGHRETFRYRELSTQATIYSMQDLKIASLVLTSRLHGFSIKYPGKNTREEVSSLLEKSLTEINTLPLRFESYGAIDIKADTEIYFSPKENAIVKGPVVFAGSTKRNIKPVALIYLINNNMLKENPTDILIIDDSEQYIRSYEIHFENRPENVYLFHFPTHNNLCAPGYKLNYISPGS